MKINKTIKLALTAVAMAILALAMATNAVADYTPEGFSVEGEQSSLAEIETTAAGLSVAEVVPVAGPYALPTTIDVSDLLIWSGVTSGIDFTVAGDLLTLTGNGPYKLTGTATNKQINIDGSVTGEVLIEIDNLVLSFSDPTGANANDCALDFGGASVSLTLAGTNIIYSGRSRAGIEVPAGASLSIGGANTASLTAASQGFSSSYGWGAGIGGGAAGGAGGTITITGGTVTASSRQGAGIGGAGGAGGTITITGGTVTASSRQGAGIGGGTRSAGGGAGAGGTVEISGTAEVKAGSASAADLGGGDSGGSTPGTSGSLSVEGDALLTLDNGNSNGTGGKPVPTISGNGTIIDGRDGSLMYGTVGAALTLAVSADQTSIIIGETITITVEISGLRSSLADPAGAVELFDGSTVLATLTSISATNKTLTYAYTAATVGTYSFTAKYTKSTTELYKDVESASLTVKVNVPTFPPVGPLKFPVEQVPSADNNYTMKADANFVLFKGVEIGGIALTAADFTAWSGSTYVRLNPTYLNNLADGKHTITLNFAGGTATATFTKTATGGGGTSSGSGSSGIASTYKTLAIPSTDSPNYNPSTGGGKVMSITAVFMIISLAGAALELRRRACKI